MTAALEAGPVTASRGVRLLADTTLDEALAADYDMVVLPGGGPGAEALDRDPRVRDLLHAMAQRGRFTAAICAAPKVLARAGLLAGRTATGYPGVLEALELDDVRLSTEAVVRDGQLITSRGPGTAMDFALELIAALVGPAKRDQVAAQLVRPGS